MLLRRTYEATFLNYVANHPDVRPWLGTDGKSRIEFGPLIEAGAVALINRDGGFLFAPKGDGVFEVHTQFLPSGHGKAWAVAREAVAFMFGVIGAAKIVTDVPEDNAPAFQLALRTGFDVASIRQDDASLSGKVQRIYEMDLTREAFAKAAAKWAGAKMADLGEVQCL